MKIGIVIPLKSKRVSNDWKTVCKNLKLTVDSVLSQTDKRYHCIVVGHDQPEFTKLPEYQNDNFLFHSIEDPSPPILGDNVMDNQLLFEADRCTKILKGILELNEINSDINYWFSLDADDLVRNDFVQDLQKYDGYDAIILEKGFFYFMRKNIFNKTSEISAYCGSSAILSNSILNLSNVTSYKNFRSIVYGDISHVHMREFLMKNGYSVAVPDERLIINMKENGENISHNVFTNAMQNVKRTIKTFLLATYVSAEQKGRFGL